MQFEKITLDEIKPSEYNPRIISEEELEKLEKNIKEFGLVDPIIINLKNNHIIGGHQRYEVLRKLAGTDTDYENTELKLIRLGNIGWVFKETDINIKDEHHEKALNLALNKISGGWDYPKLDIILDELNELNFDINLTGFENTDLTIFPNENNNYVTEDEEYDDDYYSQMEDNEEYIEPHDDEEAHLDLTPTPSQWKKKSFYLHEGETWKIGNHELKVGKPSFKDYYKIQIQQDDLGVQFIIDDNNFFEKFISKNKNNKGLKKKGDISF